MSTRLCRCGSIVSGRCERCDPAKKHAKKTKERGYGNDHRVASESRRKLFPLCEKCVMDIGVMNANPSEEMHHIVAISDNDQYRMDSNNWLALCRQCHEEIEGNTLLGMKVKQWSNANYEDVING